MSFEPKYTKDLFQKVRTDIISDMLDNPNSYGIYPTSKAFERLDSEFYNELQRAYTEIERLQRVEIKFEWIQEDEKRVQEQLQTLRNALQEAKALSFMFILSKDTAPIHSNVLRIRKQIEEALRGT